MSQAAIETLRAGYRAMSRGDWDEAFRSVHPEFELQTAGRVTSPGVYRGPEEARRFFEDLLEPFEEVTVEPLEFFEREDRIAVFVLVRSRPTGSTAAVENRVGHVWTVREGKLARLEMYPRREDAIEAAGVRK
jgi:ketosteroid isomerase-like protein